MEIQDVAAGDSVWTYNTETKEKEIGVVASAFSRNSREFIKLYFDDDSLTCILEHPFFVNEAWVEAKDLKQGDSLFTSSGDKLMLDSLHRFRAETATTVYNLEVSCNRNYFVSADRVLVHNCNIKAELFIENSIPKREFWNEMLREIGGSHYLSTPTEGCSPSESSNSYQYGEVTSPLPCDIILGHTL